MSGGGGVDPPPLTISDHCIIRWMERRHGLDMNAIRQAMFDEVLGGLASGRKVVQTKHTKAGLRIITPSGFAYIVDPVTRRVITCYEPGEYQL